MNAPLFSTTQEFAMFDSAPVALALADFSGVQRIFGEWRCQGVADLRDWLSQDDARAKDCLAATRLLAVNQRFAAGLGAHISQLQDIYRHAPDARLPAIWIDQLVLLWQGERNFAVNGMIDTVSGGQIGIAVELQIRPGYEADWSRVLFVCRDISAEENSRRRLAQSEAYARGLFEQSPVSLWVEDFSAIKTMFDAWRKAGVTHLPEIFQSQPDLLEACMRAIRVLDVNQQTLTLYAAPDKTTFLSQMDVIFQRDVLSHFSEELTELWDGKLQLQHEVVNYTLNGDPMNLLMQLSIMPGCEHDWSRVLVALTDITARKKAEASLAYLGTYDVLTGLYNRAFYMEEIQRLEKAGPYPVSVIIADLNGLKSVNDSAGHAAGDAMLRRAGNVLGRAAAEPACVARIGGDEFAVLMPAAAAPAAKQTVRKITQLTLEDNRKHAACAPLSFSAGHATCEAGGQIETAIQQADMMMYQAKRKYYAAAPEKNLRRTNAAPSR